MSLKVKDGNNDIEIMFDYIYDSEFGRLTQSTIRFNDKPIAIGSAVCSFKDNFCKAIGRKLSLSRAVKLAKEHKIIDKNISKIIWDKYRSSCK